MTKSTTQVLFIEREKQAVSKLLKPLQHVFSNTSILHTTKTADLFQQLNSKHENTIVFFSLTPDNIESELPVAQKISQGNSSILIAVVPENNSQLTSKIVELNPFFHITKPYNPVEVEIVLKRALEKIAHSAQRKNHHHIEERFCGIIGKSPQMRNIFDLINRVADDDQSTVLIRGESGTGKELVAKAIHSQSNRCKNNFVPVNCAAIPDDLLESELFGYAKGAFTGASQSKPGRIQYAEGGTLFLDEIGDMKPNLQAKLLRVLQEKEFEPVGSLQTTSVDTRILAATHCDLEQLVSEGTFREDLYYRLSVIPLHIPPLKSRKEDIQPLLSYFIGCYTTDRGKEPFIFSEQALEVLLRYNWRGNVRELENLVQHMSVLFSGKTVELADLPEKYLQEENLSEELPPSPPKPDTLYQNSSHEDYFSALADIFTTSGEIDFKQLINEFETKLIVNAMRATAGNKKEAAKLLNLKRTTLLEKIKKKRLTPEDW